MAEQTRALVIGGGAVGCSVLYHLALRGWTEAILLERDELTSGSTWHAAGNCPTFTTSWGLMRLQAASASLYRRLAADPERPIAYHVTGSVRLAHTAARMDEFRTVLGMAHAQGLAYELLDVGELRKRYPLIETEGLLGALWDPEDGDIDPAQLTQSLASAARDRGAQIRRFTPLTGLRRDGHRWRATTPQGEILADIVVNAAGYRAGEIMAMLGQELPLAVLSHQYLVTEDAPELREAASRLPLLRDPDVSYYLRQEGHGFILGPYEWQATPMWLDGLPAEFAHQLWDDDLERLGPYIEAACARVPALSRAGVRRVVNGPIPYSPDGNPYLGPAHGLPGFYHANTFSFGIAQAGGAGRLLADWIVDGGPEYDLWPTDPRRFGSYATKSYTVARAVEVYQNEYAPAFPNEERPAGRPLARSPLYAALSARGARFGARGGWERPTWFGKLPAVEGEDRLSFRRDRIFHDAVGEEVRAVRQRVGLLDLPGFTKYEISGAGCAEWLDRLLCSRLPKMGRLGLAYAVDRRGRLLSEFTVSRLAENRFYLCSAASAAQHDDDVLRAALPKNVALREVSAELGTLVLAGPRARDVLAALTVADLGNAACPWLAVREIAVAGVALTALRVNYVGELGWELHAPMAALPRLHDALHEAGATHRMADFGIYAVDSLRLDKCYRGWKSDLESGYSPYQASLDRFVDLTKEFTGRAALLAEHQRGPSQRMMPLVLDKAADADAPPLATVFADGQRVGLVTSGGWSHTLGRSIALAYVASAHAVAGTPVEVDVLGERRTARVAAEPLYDPRNERLRG